MVALQTHTIKLMKQQGNQDETHPDDTGDAWLPDAGVPQPADTHVKTKVVPLPLALQGPAAAAWQLLCDARSTEEQIDAVALLALSMQKRFVARLDKTTHLLPVVTPTNNHRALWLGGGGVGKTHTLIEVAELLTITYFGENGYAASAQSNHAAQTLGPRGRTLHAANGLLMTDSLQTQRGYA